MKTFKDVVDTYYPGQNLFPEGLRSEPKTSYSSKEDVIEDFILHKFFKVIMGDHHKKLWELAREQYGVTSPELLPKLPIDTRMTITVKGTEIPFTEKEDVVEALKVIAPEDINEKYNLIKVVRQALKEYNLTNDPINQLVFPENSKVCDVTSLIGQLKLRSNIARNPELFSQIDTFVEDLSNFEAIEDKDILSRLVQKIEELDKVAGIDTYTGTLKNPLFTVFNSLPKNAEIVVISTKKFPKLSVESKYVSNTHFRNELKSEGFSEDKDIKLFVESLPVFRQQELLEYFD